MKTPTQAVRWGLSPPASVPVLKSAPYNDTPLSLVNLADNAP
ncbi:hypothetical protein [Serratia fonticola]